MKICCFEHKHSKQFFIFLLGKGYQAGKEVTIDFYLDMLFLPLLRCSWEIRLNEKEINGRPSKQVLLSSTPQADKDSNGNADLTCKSDRWDGGWRVDWSAYWCNWPLTIFLPMGWVISVVLSQSQRTKMLHKVLNLGSGGFMFHWLTSDMAH